MPSEGSNDSWSRATAPGPEKTARKPASGGQPDPPPSEPEEPGDEASSTATSEIKSMLRRRMKQEENYRPKNSLGSVKVEEFYGDRSRYLKWKRTIQAQQHLYALEGGELAMLVYLSTRREARDVVEQHPIQAYTEAGGLQLLWRVLDEAFGESDAELFERVDKEMERCRRQPGETIAHYLSEMKRLRAQYSRVDPESKISDMAWGQRLLQRASLSRRERHDVFYAAGACFQSSAIEKALRVRCSRIHEDEKKSGFRTFEDKNHHHRPKGQQFYKKKVVIKKGHGTHMVAEEDNGIPEEEEEAMEEDTAEVLFEDECEDPEEDEAGGMEEDDMEEYDEDELKEIFAAGWKAKQRTAEVRKNRGWKTTGEKGQGGKGQKPVDLKKKSSTCSSCGKVGHWKGDACCPNVLSGRDQPHIPPAKKPAQTVHFTFMTGGYEDPSPPGHCPRCRWPVPLAQRFCGQCGQEQVQQDARMLGGKRFKQEEEETPVVKSEDDEWDVMEPTPCPENFSFTVPKHEAAASDPRGPSGTSGKGHGSVKLGPKELMAALPVLSKDVKKELQKALKEDEDRQAYQDIQKELQFTAEYLPWKMADYRLLERMEELEKRGAASTASASSGQQIQGPTRPSPPPKEGDVPKAVRDKELRSFRLGLYQAQQQGERLIPSKAAPLPTERQAHCHHPFSALRWSANQDGHYAKCKDCDLKSVIYWTVKHGAMMVALAHERPEGVTSQAKVWIREDEASKTLKKINAGGPNASQVCCRVTKTGDGQVLNKDDYTGREVALEAPLVKLITPLITEFWYVEETQVEIYELNKKKLPPHLQTPGLAIADSGCRNSVGGRLWHEAFQQALTAHQIPWQQVQEYEVYRFGAGAPVISHMACIYPVLVHGTWDVIRMSCVEGEAINCPGLIGPSELSRWKAVFRFGERALKLNGVSRPMTLTWTRHPGIQLMDYDKTKAEAASDFWVSEDGMGRRKILEENPQSLSFVAEEGEVEEAEGSEESPSEESGQEEDDRPYREKRMQQWFDRLQADLGIKVIDEANFQEESGGETSQEDDEEQSSSSHEVGIEAVSSDSEDEAEAQEDAQEREEEVARQGKKKVMNKHLRRKMGHHVHEINGSFKQEEDKMQGPEVREAFIQQKGGRKRRWSVLEVFTWTCAISLVASARHWEFHEPVTLPRWDLMKSNDYEQALEYIDRVAPDLLVLAWPCGPWSPLQTLGRKTPLQREQLAQKREENRTLLRFVRDAALQQRQRGGALLGENPKPSLAWQEPLIQEAFQDTPSTVCDMCQFGLRLPDGPFLRKRTRLHGTKEIMDRCSRICDGNHEHTPVVGGARIQGEWMPVSAFAGGYTSNFAKAVILGAEDYLSGRRRHETFAEGGHLAEEEFMEEEEMEEQEEEAEEGKEIKKGSTEWKVAQVHQRLGHPTRQTLVRMLSLAGAPKSVITVAEQYQCPVCDAVAAPGRYPKQKPTMRPTTFGKEVHLDLKYMHDSAQKLFVALSIVDGATSFHTAVLLQNRKANYVASKFHRHWCSLYGSPTTVFIDQGGEFDGEFVGWLEAHGVHSRCTGARAGWQHGFSERHGGLLGHAWHAVIWQFQAKGKADMKEALCAAIQGKNQTITRGGSTPYQMVFGRTPMFPDLLDEDTTGNLALRESMTQEGEIQRCAEMRAAAKIALLRQDCQDKLKRALRRWPRGKVKDFAPGEMVFFYAPKPTAARFKRDGGAWRGPAIVLMKESAERYYVSWRGRCLLVAGANLRTCSALEGGDFRGRVEELGHLEKKWDDQQEKAYEDLSQIPLPPEEPEEEQEEVGWKPQEGMIIPTRGGRKKFQAKEIAKSLKGLRKVQKTIKKDKSRDKVQLRMPGVTKLPRQEEEEKKEEEQPQRVQEDPEEMKKAEKAIQEQFDRWLKNEEEKDGFKKRLRDALQDDVPMSIKQKRRLEEPTGGLPEEQLRERFSPEVLHYTMLSLVTSKKRSNEWASRQEVRKMSQILDLPITSLRYHLAPRKRLQKPPKENKARITVMFGETSGTAMICQENSDEVKSRPKRRVPHHWRGMTLFLREAEKKKKKDGMALVELPHGVYEVKVEDLEEWMRLRQQEEDQQAFHEAYLLVNKANGKELDPRKFNEEEWKAFEESDAKEWASWIDNKVVRRLTPQEIKDLDPRDVFRAPARLVRVNKAALTGGFQAKSRLVVPGHQDPHLGQFRSDAPTTTWAAVQLTKIITLTRGWSAACFDVSTAFLSGRPVERKVVIKAPPEGLPAVREEKPIKPYELLLLCKSAYGLSEAPRLWYLRAKELLEELGFVELDMCRATFIMKRQNEVTAILCLHVDDGFLATAPSEMSDTQKRISSKFNIKEWQNLGEKPITFLGVKTQLHQGKFIDDMSEYVSKIQPAEIKSDKEELLAGEQLSAYRRLIMQLRWPAHLVMPEFLYRVSAFSQAVSTARGKDLAMANAVLAQMKQAAASGAATNVLYPVGGTPLFVSYFDASLGKSEAMSAQQAEIHFLTSTTVESRPSQASLLEFQSCKVHRIVRSSLAAESCAMTSAADRLLYNRALFGALYHGCTEITPQWRGQLTTDGVIITDAKGLNDHVSKTGSMASEKQTALDMLMVKRLVEDQVIRLRWVPTWKQMADPLTKEMNGDLLTTFRKTNSLCLVETAEDQLEEKKRASVRKAQRERRKMRMQATRKYNLPVM